MRGSQQADYSRSLFDERKHYSSVRMQQGRVLLDSDWNAEMDLLDHQRTLQLRDLIGASGGPAEDAGFAILADGILAFSGREQLATLDLSSVAGDRPASGFTFEARLNPRSTGAPATLLCWLRRDFPTGDPKPEMVLELDSDGRLALRRPAHSAAPLTTTERVAFGHFNHIAMSWSAQRATLFLDGRPLGSDALGGPLALADSILVLGAAIESGEIRQGWSGLLLDLALWRVERGADSIAQTLAQPPEGEEPDLLGAWRFDRPSDSVEDRGRRGLHWRLGGGDPQRSPGWSLRQIRVGRGRYYVEGALCQNDETVLYQRQPDLPGAKLPRFSRDQLYLFYLDTWQLLATSVQDPSLAEVALGGADTTVRERTVAQVRVLPLPTPSTSSLDEATREAWHRAHEGSAVRAHLRARRIASPALLGNLLYRVEVHSSGGLLTQPRQLAVGEAVLQGRVADAGPGPAGPLRLQLDGSAPSPRLGEEPWQTGDHLEIWPLPSSSPKVPGTSGEGVSAEVGVVAKLLALDDSTGLLDLQPPPTFRADPQATYCLRRVATYKWSRENASVVFPLAEIEPGARVVTLVDPDRRELDLVVGLWLEYFDDETLLDGRPSQLCRIEAIDPTLLQLTLSAAPVPSDGEVGTHPALRRWDQAREEGEVATTSGALTATTGWLALEAGIEVQFTGDGLLRARDYWWFPARSRTQSIEWPTVTENGRQEPAARPPDGIEHRYARLAVLGFTPQSFVLEDCRRTFQPRVDGAVSKAGDTMYGPLVVRSQVRVEGRGPGEPGAVHAEVFYGALGSPASVATANLTDHSVTRVKLAEELGTVPSGYSILGPTATPPTGYRWTGSVFSVAHPNARWHERSPLPQGASGPLRGAQVGGKLLVLLDSGDLLEYDAAQDRWLPRSPRPQPLWDCAVAGLGGHLYVVGGCDVRRAKSGATWIYELASDSWRQGQPLATPRSRLALAAVGGRLHALGGLSRDWLGEKATRAHEEYDPGADRWTPRAALPVGRYDLGAASLGGVLHTFGGRGRPLLDHWGSLVTNRHDEYQPAANRWLRHRPPLSAPTAHPGVAVLEDRLFVLGGEGALGPLNLVEELDAASGTWQKRPALPHASPWVAAGTLQGRLVAALDAVGCAVPPTVEMPAATRFFIHEKVQEPEPAGP
jgi:hypothetical protein